MVGAIMGNKNTHFEQTFTYYDFAAKFKTVYAVNGGWGPASYTFTFDVAKAARVPGRGPTRSRSRDWVGQTAGRAAQPCRSVPKDRLLERVPD